MKIGDVLRMLPPKKEFEELRKAMAKHTPLRSICFCVQKDMLNWCDEHTGRRPCGFSRDNPLHVLRDDVCDWLDGKITRHEFARKIFVASKIPHSWEKEGSQ